MKYLVLNAPKNILGKQVATFKKYRLKEHKTDIKNNKPTSGVAQHSNRENHTFRFDEAKIIYPCAHPKKRKIVESALIQHYENKDLSCNLNSGFSPHNSLLSYYIREVTNLQDKN